MVIRGYRGATLSEGEKALAVRTKKSPHRNILEGFVFERLAQSEA
jgi:hypothetical protein